MEYARHKRKLRLGALKGNAFTTGSARSEQSR